MGKLYFKYGVMGASKTAEALMTKYRYEEIGQKILFCKTRLDSRDSVRTVESRIGLKADGVAFLDELLTIYTHTQTDNPIQSYDVIIVDEIQFATSKEIELLADICDEYDIPIICYGLKTNFKGLFYEGSKRLFELADKLEEIKQICWCGRKALFNARIDGNGKVVSAGSLIHLGGTGSYVALCRKHYKLGIWNANM